ncbi:MAG: IS1595 family transposase [Bacteroidota bacterium]|nr:IS1595 family transposase [Bacteroidota bacterium]
MKPKTKKEKILTLKGLSKDYGREDEARELLESLRWAGEVCCPRCGSLEIVKVEANPEKKIRKGLYRCKDCRKNKTSNQFTVTVGTIFEDSHIPLSQWLQAITLLCSSKKGFSAHQLHRQLGITYKTAWFMAHRIRYAMGTSVFTGKMKGIVEADETYVGGHSRKMGRQTGWENKTPVVSLVQRKGEVRSFVVSNVTAKNLKEVLTNNVHKSANLMTDELHAYQAIGENFWSHNIVTHSKGEYVRGGIYTNTVEGFFSILKRGINGVYHHVSKEHLHRYLAEFDFRYNNRKIEDNERTLKALAGFEGKRLKYADS